MREAEHPEPLAQAGLRNSQTTPGVQANDGRRTYDSMEWLIQQARELERRWLTQGVCDLRNICLLKLHTVFASSRACTRAGTNASELGPETPEKIRRHIESISQFVDLEFIQLHSGGLLDEKSLSFLKSEKIKKSSEGREFVPDDQVE